MRKFNRLERLEKIVENAKKLKGIQTNPDAIKLVEQVEIRAQNIIEDIKEEIKEAHKELEMRRKSKNKTT